MTEQSIQTVSFTRAYLIRSALFAVLLLWPLLVFGRPSYMMDSAAYQNGGERAVSFVMRKLHIAPPPPAEHAATPSGTPAQGDSKRGADTKVARSILYSVLGYALAGPGLTMMYMAVFHAVTVALALVALFEGVAGQSGRAFAVMAGVTAFASPLAPTVTFIMPDCYAPVIVAAMAILPFYRARFSIAMRLFILGISVFGVAVHTSHPPIALGTALAVTPFLILLHRKLSLRLVPALAILWAPGVLGIMLVLLTGLVGFGKASVAPKHYPLALARAIDNGPARDYLVEECKNPHRYAVCEIYGTRIPNTVQEMLWNKDSVISRATPAQLDRIRAEENTILIETTKRYPLRQAYLIAHDVPEQFIIFKLNYFRYGSEIVENKNGDIILRNPGSGDDPAVIGALDMLNHIAVVVGAITLACWWRTMSAAQRGIVLIVLTGLLANAAVCAIFSGVASRYQARVIWLIPWLALAIGFARGGIGRMAMARDGGVR